MYLTLRYFLFSSHLGISKLSVGFVSSAFANWRQTLKPFWGLQHTSSTVVLIVWLSFFVIVLAAFFLSTWVGRNRLLFYALSAFLLAWPVTISNGATRYFYLAIPFVLLLLFESLQKLLGRRLTYVFCGILLAFEATTSIHSLQNRSCYTERRDRAMRDALTPIASDRLTESIVYLGTLEMYNYQSFLMFCGLSQVSRLITGRNDLNVYHVVEGRLFVSGDASHAAFKVYPVSGGFRFVSTVPSRAFLLCEHAWGEGIKIPHSMGYFVLNKKDSVWQASDVTFFSRTSGEVMLF